MLLWLQMLLVNIWLSRVIERKRWRCLTVVHVVCFIVVFSFMILLSDSPIFIRAIDVAFGSENAAILRSALDYAGSMISVMSSLSLAIQLLTLILVLLKVNDVVKRIKKHLEYKWYKARRFYITNCKFHFVSGLSGRKILTRHCRCNS